MSYNNGYRHGDNLDPMPLYGPLLRSSTKASYKLICNSLESFPLAPNENTSNAHIIWTPLCHKTRAYSEGVCRVEAT